MRLGTIGAVAGVVSAKADDLKKRTEAFARRVVELVRTLPGTLEARKVGAQLIDAATSVAANYRAACRARSHPEFVAKIGLVLEESDESEFWLGFLAKSGIAPEASIKALHAEAYELTAIFAASHKTASARKRRSAALP